MPCYVDMKHLERAREALMECDRLSSDIDLYSHDRVSRIQLVARAALDSTSHATDYMTQPVADYVPTATTITEAQTTKES